MKLSEIQSISVIGAGDMGHGIAEVAALSGYEVNLYDVHQDALDRGMENICKSLKNLVGKGKIDQNTHDNCLGNLQPTLDMSEAVANAQLVIEAVPEVLQLKQKVFQQLSAMTSPETILATNTSNMSITEIGSVVENPGRVLGVHFFNPALIMKLVEVIRGDETSDNTFTVVYEFCKKIDKIPVRVEKDSPGFIVNRINAPVRTYLGTIVDQGIAEPYEVDALFKYHGHPMGHFELSDFVGLDVLHDSCVYRGKVLHPEYGPYQKLVEKVMNKELGKKTGKGFYDWSNGRPQIDVKKRTDKLKLVELDYIKLNEAAKLIEDKVATPEDLDTAMVVGTGDKLGVIEACKGKNGQAIVKRLEEISETYHKEVLKPCRLLKEDIQSLLGS